MNKTKVMVKKHAEYAFFSISDEILEQVEEYNYLGQIASADPNHEKEIRRRVGLHWGAFGEHSQIMKSKIPLSKRMAFNQCVQSVALNYNVNERNEGPLAAEDAARQCLCAVTCKVV